MGFGTRQERAYHVKKDPINGGTLPVLQVRKRREEKGSVAFVVRLVGADNFQYAIPNCTLDM